MENMIDRITRDALLTEKETAVVEILVLEEYQDDEFNNQVDVQHLSNGEVKTLIDKLHQISLMAEYDESSKILRLEFVQIEEYFYDMMQEAIFNL